MNWTIRVSKKPSLVRVTLRGLFEMDEFRRVMDAVAAAIDDLTFRPVLFDERELDMSRVTMPQMIEMRELASANNIAFAYRKVAVVASSAPALAVFNTYKELSIPVSRAVIGSFAKEREALAWLADQNRL